MFEKASKKSFLINGSHHGRSTLSRLSIAEIVMHDFNIKETKLETSVLSLSLFS